MPIARRIKFDYKANKVVKPSKTNRTELSIVARAFAVGALTAIRGDYASQHELANVMGWAQSSLSELLFRTEKKAERLTRVLWDNVLYNTAPRREKDKLLTRDQKHRIIALVTSSRGNCEKERRLHLRYSLLRNKALSVSFNKTERLLIVVRYRTITLLLSI
jgi:hypothetical protein